MAHDMLCASVWGPESPHYMFASHNKGGDSFCTALGAPIDFGEDMSQTVRHANR